MMSVSLYNDSRSLIHVSYFTKKDGSTCLQTNGVEMEKMRGEAELFNGQHNVHSILFMWNLDPTYQSKSDERYCGRKQR